MARRRVDATVYSLSFIRVTDRAFVVALLLGACGNPQGPVPPQVEERRISPVLANARVTEFTDDHYVWVPRGALSRASRIMLLLPGTNGRPANARLIGRVAAEQGYRAIGLMYPDDRAVVFECSGNPDAACMANMREEVVEGVDLSTHVTVDRDNSIAGRLADLLRDLAREHPDERWGDFLQTDGSVRWDAVAVSGLSQGGGHAAYIAKLHSFDNAHPSMFGDGATPKRANGTPVFDAAWRYLLGMR